MRLYDLQGETHGAGRIEGVATVLQRRHAGGCRQPVGRGTDPEGASDLGPSGKAAHGVA